MATVKLIWVLEDKSREKETGSINQTVFTSLHRVEAHNQDNELWAKSNYANRWRRHRFFCPLAAAVVTDSGF